jgi:cellulose synthase/poly-beta-1,6-N-acetylglucosamine synthase-like glycosyltransferase
VDSFWFFLQAGISLIYLLYFFLISRIKTTPLSLKKEFQPFVSVVIASKNEAHQLYKNLLPILQQAYHKNGIPNFEVVVVNDHSTDHSTEVLKKISNEFTHFRYIDFQENKKSSKKRALTKAVKESHGEYLIFTDADCQPTSNKWLLRMVEGLDTKKIILGYGGFYKKSNWLNKVQSYETFITALQYFSFAQNLSPYMGVGRNLAYRKDAFTSNKGFSNHEHIASGDDDLFIQEVATKQNTGTCIVQEAFTRSEAPQSWKAWLHQKKRHITTSSAYKIEHQLLLGSIGLIRTSYWSISIISFLFAFHFSLFLNLTILWVCIGMLLSTTLIHLQQKRLLVFLFFLDAKLMLFHLILLFSKFQPKATSWK